MRRLKILPTRQPLSYSVVISALDVFVVEEFFGEDVPPVVSSAVDPRHLRGVVLTL